MTPLAIPALGSPSIRSMPTLKNPVSRGPSTRWDPACFICTPVKMIVARSAAVLSYSGRLCRHYGGSTTAAISRLKASAIGRTRSRVPATFGLTPIFRRRRLPLKASRTCNRL